MEYIYTARIEINQENAMKILTASRQLQVKGLIFLFAKRK